MIVEAIAKTFERRSNLRNPDDWLVDAMVGPRTVSGMRAGVGEAMTLASFYAGVRNISEDVGKLPLKFYERVATGGKREAVEESLWFTLHDQPNPEMSSLTFRETLTQHAIVLGDGYAEIVRVGRDVDLWPLDPTRVRIERDRSNGALRYVLPATHNERERIFRSQDIFHLHGLGFKGLGGYSVATMARESIGVALALRASGAALFGNNSRPGGVLQTPNKLDDAARRNMRESWERVHGGAESFHKTAILEQGVTFTPIAITNKDAMWIEAGHFSVEEFARWLRIPPHKIQHLLRSTFSNIVAQNIEYVTDTLMPWLIRWEQEIQRKLITPMFGVRTRSPFFAEHVVDALLRGDIETRYRAYAIARNWGWESANSILGLENRNPIGPQGDVYLVPENMANAERLLDEPEPPSDVPPPGDDDGDNDDNGAVDASVRLLALEQSRRVARDVNGDDEKIQKIADVHSPMLVEAFRRVLRVEVKQVTNRAKSGKFDDWVEVFYTEHVQHVRGALIPVVETFVGSVWAALDYGVMLESVTRAVAEETDAMARRHCDASRNGLRRTASSVLKATLESWSNGRANTSAIAEMRRLVKVIRPMRERS